MIPTRSTYWLIDTVWLFYLLADRLQVMDLNELVVKALGGEVSALSS